MQKNKNIKFYQYVQAWGQYVFHLYNSAFHILA